MKWTHTILTAITFPWFLTTSLVLLVLLRVTGFVDDVRLEKNFIVTADITKRGARFWKYSTTIGRLIFLHPRVYELRVHAEVLAHEMVHVRQHEDLMFIGWILSIGFGPVFTSWWPGFVIWWSAGLWQLLMYVSAALRFGFKNAYIDAEHERAAYAQTNPWHDGKTAWIDLHEKLLRPKPKFKTS